MRRRERNPDNTVTLDEPPARRAVVPDVPPSGEPSATAVVDEALRVAARRELFTRTEALGLLHQVEVSTHDLPSGTQVGDIVASFERGTTEQLMCSRADLVDPLLDIRLAVDGVPV